MVHKIIKLAEMQEKDEKKAPIPYMKLKKLVPYKNDKKILAGIIADEREHHKKIISMIGRYKKMGKNIKKKGLPDID
jgi:rubrerythrin